MVQHPWHEVRIGDKVPERLNAIIEIPKGSRAKYEIDKESGLIKLDRVIYASMYYPLNYGFIPQTFCGAKVGEHCSEKTGKPGIVRDGDPIDICVLTEKAIAHGDLLVNAIPIGGFRMIDGGQADDKIIAVMYHDEIYSGWDDIDHMPLSLVERLKHYFLTYKAMPGAPNKAEITHLYNKQEAREIIKASMEDYFSLIKSE